MAKRMKTIYIEWEGPYSLYDIGYDEKSNKAHPYILKNAVLNNERKDFGIYQIYGFHPVYGANQLLYIGKAEDQTFAKRISQEEWEYNYDYKNIEIYVGRIYNTESADPLNSDGVWSQAIDDAESMLIYVHEPARNASNILNVSKNEKRLKELEDIRIFNYGTHRSLMPEISGEMWIKGLEDFKLFGEA